MKNDSSCTFPSLCVRKLMYFVHIFPWQSDTAKVIVPELDLELEPGTLGGLVTTVEGLMKTISESMFSVFFLLIFDLKFHMIGDLYKPFYLMYFIICIKYNL